MDWLRNALQLRWIGSSRVTGYSRVLAFVSLVSFAHFFAQATGPDGSDFLAFWSAGKLAAAGHADQAYDLAAVQAVQALLGRSSYFAFVNPPPFILLCLPFGLLPYPAAWIAWVAAGYPKSWAVSQYLLDHSDRTFFLRQVTVYAALRAMDLQPFAAGAQTIVSLVVAGLVARAWARPGPVEAKLAMLAAAIPLATPYLFSYDLPFLIVPIVWLIQQERERPTFGWQRLILTALYLSPLIARAAERRAQAQEEVTYFAEKYRRARDPRLKARYLDEWHWEQRMFDLVNDVVGPRYKAKLENRSYAEGASREGKTLEEFRRDRAMRDDFLSS